MSRIGKLPVPIPSGVEIALDDRMIRVKGPKGALEERLPGGIDVEVGADQIVLQRKDERKPTRSAHGLARALVANMVTGVTDGFSKELEVQGVGYRAEAAGKVLKLSLGFSHPVEHLVPEGVTVETPSQTEILVRGADKQQVGQVAAEIRGYRPPEPYKGKGVRYSDERVVIKEAKKK